MLNNQVALVTGASSGIGRAVALAYARAGAAVLVSDVAVAGGEETVALVRAEGGQASFFAADVANPSDCAALAAAAVQRFGRLDIACNNAGIGGDLAPTADYTVEAWNKVIAVNLSGVFFCMKAQIPHMLAGGGGTIVNMASILGAVGFANAPAYTAAKHGVLGLTKAAAQEYGAQGVRVNAVGPAFIQTPMIAGMEADPATNAALVAMHPIGRLGRPEEVAALVLWLSSAGGVVRHRGVLPGGRRLPGALKSAAACHSISPASFPFHSPSAIPDVIVEELLGRFVPTPRLGLGRFGCPATLVLGDPVGLADDAAVGGVPLHLAGLGVLLPFALGVLDVVVEVAAGGDALGDLRLGADVDPHAGEARRQPCVLTLTADRQAELVIGHDHVGGGAVLGDVDLVDLGRRQRLGDHVGEVLAERHDVDLLAAQLVDDHADTGTPARRRRRRPGRRCGRSTRRRSWCGGLVHGRRP